MWTGKSIVSIEQKRLALLLAALATMLKTHKYFLRKDINKKTFLLGICLRFVNLGIAKIGLTPLPPMFLAHSWILRQKSV